MKNNLGIDSVVNVGENTGAMNVNINDFSAFSEIISSISELTKRNLSLMDKSNDKKEKDSEGRVVQHQHGKINNYFSEGGNIINKDCSELEVEVKYLKTLLEESKALIAAKDEEISLLKSLLQSKTIHS